MCCSVLIALACGKPHMEHYLLSDRLTPGYVVIEYGNPKCPAADVGLFTREIYVEPSGYACTSSQLDHVVYVWKYYRVDSRGSRTPLAEGKDFFAPSTLGRANGEQCIQAQIFLYGNAGPVPKRDWWQMIEARHPECIKVIHARPVGASSN